MAASRLGTTPPSRLPGSAGQAAGNPRMLGHAQDSATMRRLGSSLEKQELPSKPEGQAAEENIVGGDRHGDSGTNAFRRGGG